MIRSITRLRRRLGHLRARSVILNVGACLALLYLARSGLLPRNNDDDGAARPPLALASSPSTAARRTGYGDAIRAFKDCNTWDAVADRDEGVLLSATQILWVADMLHLAYASNSGGGGKKGDEVGEEPRPPSLLVFGLGNDSPLWAQLNCKGRTVFVEDDADWIKKVEADVAAAESDPLEVHRVSYSTTLAEADAYWKDPVDLKIHPSVDGACFDVILVDAPYAATPESRGRMMPAHFARQRARACEGPTVVFLHDTERPGETDIMNRVFSTEQGWAPLGFAKGDYGWLGAWVLESKLGPAPGPGPALPEGVVNDQEGV